MERSIDDFNSVASQGRRSIIKDHNFKAYCYFYNGIFCYLDDGDTDCAILAESPGFI